MKKCWVDLFWKLLDLSIRKMLAAACDLPNGYEYDDEIIATKHNVDFNIARVMSARSFSFE